MRVKLSVGLLAGTLALLLLPVNLIEAQPRDAGARIRGEIGQAAGTQSRTRQRAYSTARSRAVRPEATTEVETAYSRLALPFEVGDQIVVARESARLMRGRDVLGSLPSGEQMRVLQIRGPWVGVVGKIAGRETGGWLWYSHVAPADQAQASTDAQR